jgi:hypothetical protein
MQGILSTKEYDTKNNQMKKTMWSLILGRKKKHTHKDTFKATEEKET